MSVNSDQNLVDFQLYLKLSKNLALKLPLEKGKFYNFLFSTHMITKIYTFFKIVSFQRNGLKHFSLLAMAKIQS